MKFEKTAPESYKFKLGEGSFRVETENKTVASLLSKNLVQGHVDIVTSLFNKVSQNIPDAINDIVAVLETTKKEETTKYCTVLFSYYVV